MARSPNTRSTAQHPSGAPRRLQSYLSKQVWDPTTRKSWADFICACKEECKASAKQRPCLSRARSERHDGADVGMKASRTQAHPPGNVQLCVAAVTDCGSKLRASWLLSTVRLRTSAPDPPVAVVDTVGLGYGREHR